jgi:probable rRNA maturation factor
MKQTAALVLNKAAELYALSPQTEVGLTWADDAYIQKLNLEYRGKDMPTDVLSFALNDTLNEEPEILNTPGDAEILLGDIIISLETAARQAEEYGHSFLREIAFLTVHGILHLLGYDHLEAEEEQEMRQEEKYILTLLNITRDN